MFSVAAATFLSGYSLSEKLDLSQPEPVNESQQSTTNPLKLEVKPSTSEPKPLDFELQAGSQNLQEPESNLQQSQDSSNLQPNAKEDSF